MMGDRTAEASLGRLRSVPDEKQALELEPEFFMLIITIHKRKGTVRTTIVAISP